MFVYELSGSGFESSCSHKRYSFEFVFRLDIFLRISRQLFYVDNEFTVLKCNDTRQKEPSAKVLCNCTLHEHKLEKISRVTPLKLVNILKNNH